MFVLYLQTATETIIFYITIYICVCVYRYIRTHTEYERFNLGYILALLVPGREDLFYLES